MTPTPGPWRLHPDGLSVFGAGPDAQQVADLGVCSPNIRRNEQFANARLIAAAPAMLEALHAVWVLAETMDIGNFERARICETVGGVLDQAEGRTPARTP
jgi:hypothetical protein